MGCCLKLDTSELKSGNCTSGHCASGQLFLTWFPELDGWVPASIGTPQPPASVCQDWGRPSGQGTSFLSIRNVILVVDDDPGTRRGVKRLLREHGYDSVLFSSVQAFENQVDFEDAFCVVLDINLGIGRALS